MTLNSVNENRSCDIRCDNAKHRDETISPLRRWSAPGYWPTNVIKTPFGAVHRSMHRLEQ